MTRLAPARPAAACNLLAIVSPAKKMARPDDFEPQGAPRFAHAARALAERLQAMGPDELQALWKCSDALARTARDDLRALRPEGFADDPAALPAPAAMAYVGIQYQSMAPQVMSEAALGWLQGHLRIVSGLFGLLRPFDGVAPYRLEMQARLAMPCRVLPDGSLADEPARNLYEFWGAALAHRLEDPAPGASGAPHVVNLASVEYADAVLPHLSPETPVTTCIFLEPRAGGGPVQRATASKIARGTMVRWMAEEGVESPTDLAAFDLGGYRLDPARCREDGPRRLLAFVKGA